MNFPIQPRRILAKQIPRKPGRAPLRKNLGRSSLKNTISRHDRLVRQSSACFNRKQTKLFKCQRTFGFRQRQQKIDLSQLKLFMFLNFWKKVVNVHWLSTAEEWIGVVWCDFLGFEWVEKLLQFALIVNDFDCELEVLYHHHLFVVGVWGSHILGELVEVGWGGFCVVVGTVSHDWGIGDLLVALYLNIWIVVLL